MFSEAVVFCCSNCLNPISASSKLDRLVEKSKPVDDQSKNLPEPKEEEKLEEKKQEKREPQFDEEKAAISDDEDDDYEDGDDDEDIVSANVKDSSLERYNAILLSQSFNGLWVTGIVKHVSNGVEFDECPEWCSSDEIIKTTLVALFLLQNLFNAKKQEWTLMFSKAISTICTKTGVAGEDVHSALAAMRFKE